MAAPQKTFTPVKHLFLHKWIALSNRFSVRLVLALLVALGFNVLFGIGFYLAERGGKPELTLLDSIWWSMVTMTTVGYGDFSPSTFAGRFLVAYPCFIIGMALIGYLLGLVADGVINQLSRQRKGLMDIKLTEHYLVCNCPKIEKVLILAEELRARTRNRYLQIAVLDGALEEAPSEFLKHDIHFLRGAPTEEACLMRANLPACAGVIVLARDPLNSACDAETYATGSVIEQVGKDYNRNIPVVVELVSRKNSRLLSRAATDGVISVEGLVDRLLVQEILSPGASSVFEELVSSRCGVEFHTVECRLVGRRLVDLQIAALQSTVALQIVGILRNGEANLAPSPTETVQQGDKLVLIAEDPRLYKTFEERLSAA